MTLDFRGLPSFRFSHPTSENLPRLARLAYEASALHCGDCRNYHLTTPYLRALGIGGLGPEFAWEIQVETLLRAVEGRSTVRWLLAGAADAGLLGLIEGVAARLPGTAHHITIVDRCDTPLALCRDHAASLGRDIVTMRGDLRDHQAPDSADVVLMHFTTVFVPEAERVAFIRHASTWLAAEGRLAIALFYDRPETASSPSGSNAAVRSWRAGVIRAEAAAGTFDPPEDVETFVGRLDQRGFAATTRAFTLGDGLALLRSAALQPREVALLPRSAAEAAIWGTQSRQRSIVVASREL